MHGNHNKIKLLDINQLEMKGENMVRILVNGANGKMGQEVVKAISEADDLKLVGTSDKEDNLTALIQSSKAQVVVDFTNASSVFENAQKIIKTNVCPVVGTSGLLPDQINILQEQAKQKMLGGIIVPNFSMGAILMMQYAKAIAPYYSAVEIIEMHHDQKQDAPSGTALKTAEMISTSRTFNTKETEREVVPGSRGARVHGIPIHAVRLPGLLAHQQVLFGGGGETFTLKHNILDRKAFIPGILLACKKVVGLNKLVVGLEHVLP